MQSLGWQDLVALLVVFAAAAYLVRLAWGAIAAKLDGACGTGCARCPAGADASPSGPEQIVTIGAAGAQIRH